VETVEKKHWPEGARQFQKKLHAKPRKNSGLLRKEKLKQISGVTNDPTQLLKNTQAANGKRKDPLIRNINKISESNPLNRKEDSPHGTGS
jgi:hypothetical protein